MEQRQPVKKTGVVIAATHSGSGKTTLALGIMAALKRRGFSVQPFKVGPDFIDPGHHTHVTGRQSRNLDGWMLSRPYNQRLFFRLMQNADCAVVEGVMGLFDGFNAVSDTGSTAEMAKWLDLPVLLMVDASSMARSAAAVVRGFETFDDGLTLAGVVFNRVGSDAHLAILKEAVSHYCTVPCLGGLPRDESLIMPERHLGLVTSEEGGLSQERIARLAEVVEGHLDLDRLLKTCALDIPEAETAQTTQPTPAARVRIAVARDAAFCFYYPDNLELLERFGAELIFFSPLRDERLPEGCHGIYLGGGYPEVFAETLSENCSMLHSVREAGGKGCPIYAECGGLMFLSAGITTFKGIHYPMARLFPFATRMLPRFRALGYREIRLKQGGPLGQKGAVARGHEFHYSEIAETDGNGLETYYAVKGRRVPPGRSGGYRIDNSLASYIHLHFGSNPEIARNWIAFCAHQNILT